MNKIYSYDKFLYCNIYDNCTLTKLVYYEKKRVKSFILK